MRRRLVVPLLALCLGPLAGCSSSGAGIELLDRPATSTDALPPDAAVAGFHPGTTRLAARTGGFTFYLARPPLAGGTGNLPPGWGACLIVAEPEVISCGSAPLKTRFFGVSAQLVPDGFDASTLTSAGWEQVQRNLFVKGLDHSSRTPPRHPVPKDEG